MPKDYHENQAVSLYFTRFNKWAYEHQGFWRKADIPSQILNMESPLFDTLGLQRG